MKSASISEIKKELKTLSQEQVTDLCMQLAKYKKDNKEFLNYLLFEAIDEDSFIRSVKMEIEEQFAQINTSQLYLAKKTIRKVLRTTNKYIKYSGNKQTETELLIYFCKCFKKTGINISRYTILSNLYQNQLKKIDKSLSSLHEDIRFDFEVDLEEINKYIKIS